MRITSSDNPRIKAVVRLHEQRERRRTGLFVAEGGRVIARALAAGLELRQGYVCPALLAGASSAGEARAESYLAGLGPAASAAPWHEVAAGPFRKMAFSQSPEGVLAVLAQRAGPAGLDGLPVVRAPLYLVAVGIAKPGNLGAMARTAAAAGAHGLIVADGVVDRYNPAAIRASTGAVFALPIVEGGSAQVIAFLAGRGVRIFAAAPQADLDYSDADLTGAAAIVIGAEDQGLAPPWLAVRFAPGFDSPHPTGAAARSGILPVRIPMQPGVVDSLNASVAAAVLLFEAVRQRRAK